MKIVKIRSLIFVLGLFNAGVTMAKENPELRSRYKCLSSFGPSKIFKHQNKMMFKSSTSNTMIVFNSEDVFNVNYVDVKRSATGAKEFHFQIEDQPATIVIDKGALYLGLISESETQKIKNYPQKATVTKPAVDKDVLAEIDRFIAEQIDSAVDRNFDVADSRKWSTETLNHHLENTLESLKSCKDILTLKQAIADTEARTIARVATYSVEKYEESLPKSTEHE